MTADRFATQLRAWMEDEADAGASSRMYDAIFTATATTPQARRWPLWPPVTLQPTSTRRPSVVLVLMLLVATAAAVLAGAGLGLLPIPRPAPTAAVRAAQEFARTCAHPHSIATVGSETWAACVDQIRWFDRNGTVNGAVPGSAVSVDEAGAWVVVATGVRALDPASLRLGTIVPAPGTTDLALDADSTWAMNPTQELVVRVERATNRVVATIRLPSRPASLVAGAGRVWVALPDLGRIAVIDPASNSVTDLVAVATPAAVSFGAGAVWVLSDAAASVTSIDPSTLHAEVHLAVLAATSIAVDGRDLWLAAGAEILELDATTVQPIRHLEARATGPLVIGGLAATAGQVLLLDPSNDRILSVTP